MKIEGPNGTMPLKSVQGGKSSPKPAKGSQNHKDRVEVSTEAKVLSAAKAPEQPDVSRIERLKEQIANGSFEIDHDMIADKMLKEELEGEF